MTRDDIFELVGRSYLFRDLDPPTRARVAGLAHQRRLGDGETLFLKGDEGDALYGVLAGKIRITATSAGGREVLLNILEPGEVFGEIALLDGLPRTADAAALGETRLFTIRRGDFVGLLAGEPALAVHLLALLCRRLREMSERIEDAVFLPLPARLAKRLLMLERHYGEDDPDGGRRIGLPISQNELGQLLGTSRESINKHLQTWRRSGWIALERRHVVIRDLAALEAVVTAGAAT